MHILWGLGYGGIETMLVNIANGQSQSGATVTIVIINDLYEDSLLTKFSPDVRIRLLHRKCHSKNFSFILKLNNEIRQSNPDIIHLHDSRIYSIILCPKFKLKTCTTLHALPTGKIRFKGMLTKVFPFFNILNSSGNVSCIDKIPHVFSISYAVQNALYNNYKVSSIVVRNGIQTSYFKSRSLHVLSYPMRIVQIGRLSHENKGQDLLIEVVAEMRGQVTLDLIGTGSSLDYLQKLTNKLGVDSYVNFLGKQSQEYIANHLRDYDIFVQPSRREGFGLTVAEAMVAGVPVLVSTGQGPEEVTCGELYGWTFENGNVRSLKEKIKYIKLHYAEAMNKAKYAQSYVINNYDISATVNNYMAEYKKF